MSASYNSHATDIGAELKKARESLGLTVEDVCTSIKLHVSAIEHIERGDLEKLGPAVYARGFVKSYAKCVRMPQDWTTTALAQLALDSNSAPTLLPSRGHRPETATSDRGMQAASYLVGTAILVSGIFYMTQLDRLVAPDVVQAPLPNIPVETSTSQTPQPLTSPTPTAAGVTAESNTTLVAGTVDNSMAVAPTVSGIPSVLSQTPPAIANNNVNVPVNEPAIAAGLGQLPNVSPPNNQFVLAVTGTVWVEITDANGRRLEFNNLTSGARKSYNGQAPYALKIGNASNATLSVSGTTIDLAPYTLGSVAKLQLVNSNGVLTPVR
jgi:cytoskeleton protein RodZ